MYTYHLYVLLTYVRFTQLSKIIINGGNNQNIAFH